MIKDVKQLEGPLRILLLGVLLAHLGTYLVMPVLPIMLRAESGLSLSQIGTILACIAIAFQVGSISGGVLADRIGRRFIIGLGAIITASGMIGFGLFDDYRVLLLIAVVVGLGNGLNAPSTKASIAAFASSENQTTAFSMRGIAANIGVATAGLVVFFVMTDSSRLIFWISGAIYAVLALVSWALLPKKCGELPCPPITQGAYTDALKNKPFLVFSAITVFIWALYAQLSLVLPLRAAVILKNPENIALIWTINSFIVITLQSTITKKLIKKVHPLSALGLGIGFVTVGIVALFFAQSFFHFVWCGAIFVIGEMLILPTIDSSISHLSKADLVSLFFALANVVYGIGEAAGKSAGGFVLEGSNQPWMLYGITGVVIIIALLFLRKWKPLHQSLLTHKKSESRTITTIPSEHRTQPYSRWEPEVFFRKEKRWD